MKYIKILFFGLIASLVLSLNGVVWNVFPMLHSFIFMDISFGLLMGQLIEKWFAKRRNQKEETK